MSFSGLFSQKSCTGEFFWVIFYRKSCAGEFIHNHWYSLVKSYPADKIDLRPHGLLCAIPYPIGCATTSRQTGTVAVWKRKYKGEQVMTWVDLKAKEMDTGLAWLLDEYWAAKGQQYKHPSLETLVEPTEYACVESAREFGLEKVLDHYPTFATSAADTNLRGYLVKWETFSELSYVPLNDMLDCAEIVAEYWAKRRVIKYLGHKGVILSTNVCCKWSPKPHKENTGSRYRQLLCNRKVQIRSVYGNAKFIPAQSSPSS